MHGHPQLFQHHPSAHIFGPCIHCGKFVVALDLNITSSMLLSWLSFRCQTVCPTSLQPYFSGLWLFLLFIKSFLLLTGFHSFVLCPPSFIIITSMDPFYAGHPWFQALSPHFGGATCHGFHPEYPIKFCQNHCWMTCCPPWLPQPPPSFFTLLFMAWTCWMQALHSWFHWLLF